MRNRMLRAMPKNLRRHSANNRYRNTEYIAQSEKLLRNKNAIELLGVWEQIYNPQSNSPEFEGIKSQAGFNRFASSIKQWTEKTNSKGIIAKELETLNGW